MPSDGRRRPGWRACGPLSRGRAAGLARATACGKGVVTPLELRAHGAVLAELLVAAEAGEHERVRALARLVHDLARGVVSASEARALLRSAAPAPSPLRLAAGHAGQPPWAGVGAGPGGGWPSSGEGVRGRQWPQPIGCDIGEVRPSNGEAPRRESRTSRAGRIGRRGGAP